MSSKYSEDHYDLPGLQITLAQSDLATLLKELHFDVVISPDDNELSMSGGASLAISEAYPDAMGRAPALMEVSAIKLGSIISLGETPTTATALGTQIAQKTRLFSAITRDFNNGVDLSFASAEQLYLDLADQIALRCQGSDLRVMLPLLGTGVGSSISQAESLKALLSATNQRLGQETISQIVIPVRPEEETGSPTSVEILKQILQTEIFRSDRGEENQSAGEAIIANDLDNQEFGCEPWAQELDDLPQEFRVDNVKGVRIEVPRTELHQLQFHISESLLLQKLLEDTVAIQRKLAAQLEWNFDSHSSLGTLTIKSEENDQDLAAFIKRTLPEAVKILKDLGIESLPDNKTPTDKDEAAQVVSRAKAPPDPARQLAHAIPNILNEDALNRLKSECEERGYKGDFGSQLLECCVQDDPVRFISDRVNIYELQTYLEKHFGQKADPQIGKEELAQHFLHNLGFPAPTKLMGTNTVLCRLRKTESKLRHPMSNEKITGEVASTSQHLELIFLVLLRFICKSVYETSPEPFLKEQGWLQETMSLNKCSLGTLIDLINRLDKKLKNDAKGEGVVAIKIKALQGSSLDATKLIPNDLRELASLRNAAGMHWTGVAGDSKLQETAKFYVNDAIKLLEYYANTTNCVFPTLIKITEIHTDGWGRTIVKAVREQEIEEQIFTSESLDVGRIYMMLPSNNPLRVDPKLVPVGDLFDIQLQSDT